ncbi:50S ribosomal protein L19 [Patescibacteria group bacterium]|nr:50S ribosomal protein L19 [Patescibacteria group bacterium]
MSQEETKEEQQNDAPQKETIEEKPIEQTESDSVEDVEQEDEETKTPNADEVIPETFEGEAKVIELPHKNIRTGMVVRVHEKIKDTNSKGEEKERIQVFEGLVIGTKSSGKSRTMTVRKNSKGWMVEKIFPLSSPVIEKIEVVKQYRNKRAKLTFLRGRFRRKLKEVK